MLSGRISGVEISIGVTACNGSDSVLEGVGLSDVVPATFPVGTSGICVTAIAVVSEECSDGCDVLGLSVTSSMVEALL